MKVTRDFYDYCVNVWMITIKVAFLSAFTYAAFKGFELSESLSSTLSTSTTYLFGLVILQFCSLTIIQTRLESLSECRVRKAGKAVA